MFVVELSPSSANVGFVIGFPSILNPSVVKVGTPPKVSFAVAVSLMMLPCFAKPVLVLFDAIVTVVNSGSVVSTFCTSSVSYE